MSEQFDEREGLPSASDTAFWNCAGQRNLLLACNPEPEPSSPDAERGTRIHDAFQTGNPSALSSEEFDTYKRGVEFLEKLLAQWITDKGIVKYAEQPREKRYWMVSDYFNPIASAKLDRHFLGTDADGKVHILIADLKTGFIPNLVSAPRSTQLRVQLCCMFLESDIEEVASARVAFVKAKRFEGFRDYCDYARADIESATRWMQTHIWLSEQQDTPRTPGQHCDHCPVKGFCREAGAYSMLPAVVVGTSDIESRVASLSETDLVKLWESQGIINKILKAVSTRLKKMPLEQLQSMGLDRGKGSETPEIADIAGCIEYLRGRQFTDAEIYSCMEFSTTKLATVFRKNCNLSSDEKAKEYTKKVLADFIITKVSEQPLKKI